MHKDLGITFTDNLQLQWSEHYKIIAAKAKQTLGLLIVLLGQAIS